MTAERQVARAASTDQMRAEAKSKEAAQMRPGMDELAAMRKELMDVKSQMNQMRVENNQLRKESAEYGAGRFQGRGGYQGNGGRGYNHGGWSKENRGHPYKPRGGARPTGPKTEPAPAPMEEKRERGYYIRSIGWEDAPEDGGEGLRWARRVRIKAAVEVDELMDADEKELFAVPVKILDPPNIQEEPVGKRTRFGTRRGKEAEQEAQERKVTKEVTDDPDMPDLEALDAEKEVRAPEGPKRPTELCLTKYAWGTGGAEHAPDMDRLGKWLDFVEDPRYNFLRRKSVLKPLGVEVREEPSPDRLLMYFPWPGPVEYQMPAGEVWGTGLEERILRCNREIRDGAAPAERAGLMKEMEQIRKDIAQQHMEEDEDRMHESQEHWWHHKQVKEGLQRLHERLGMLTQEADQGLLDTRNFILAYDCIMLNFERREGKFAWEAYERVKVLGEHARYYAYESELEVTMTKDKEKGYRVEMSTTKEARGPEEWSWNCEEYEALHNGKAEKPKNVQVSLDENAEEEMESDMITATGMEKLRDSMDKTVDWTSRGMEYEAQGAVRTEDENKETPDWDSPAEGIKAGNEAGGQDRD